MNKKQLVFKTNHLGVFTPQLIMYSTSLSNKSKFIQQLLLLSLILLTFLIVEVELVLSEGGGGYGGIVRGGGGYSGTIRGGGGYCGVVRGGGGYSAVIRGGGYSDATRCGGSYSDVIRGGGSYSGVIRGNDCGVTRGGGKCDWAGGRADGPPRGAEGVGGSQSTTPQPNYSLNLEGKKKRRKKNSSPRKKSERGLRTT